MKKLVLPLFLLSATVFAGPFSITNRSGFNSTLDAAADAIESAVNDGFLSETFRTNFLKGMGDAATSSTSGIIAERGMKPKVFVAGVGAQVGVAGGLAQLTESKSKSNSLPSIGVGFQGSLLVGVPASTFGLKKLDQATFFLSFGTTSLNSSAFSFSMFNVGLNGTYQVLGEKGIPWLVKWGGVRLLTGINYASDTVGYTGTLDQQSSSVSVNMDLDIGIKSTNIIIPFEVSTSLQLLFINFYAGGAVDFNFGSAKFTGVSNGTVSTGSAGATADAILNLDDGLRGKTSLLGVRGFFGAEIVTWVMRIGAEASVLSNSAKSVSAFARVAL